MILMIDSIDQLTNENLARSNLSFLRGVKPHRDTRIIVSALPDEKDADGKWIYCYGCDTKLAIRNVPRVVVRRLEESKAGEIKEMLSTILWEEHKMRPREWQLELAARQISVDPTALYLRLAVFRVKDWVSSASEEECLRSLPATVPALIESIFEDLERTYGEILVRTTLGLLTYSRGGVSKQELGDLLSMDDEVLAATFQYSDPGVRRLPPHILLRLLGSLEGLVMERDNV